MRTAAQAVRVALATHDEAAITHVARNDAKHALFGVCGALAVNPQTVLEFGVVVVAVDEETHVGDVLAAAMVDIAPDGSYDALDHHATVVQRELQAERQVVDVVLTLGRINAQAVVTFTRLPVTGGELHVVRGDLVTDVARARVDDNPDAVLLVVTDLDEVVPATERADLLAGRTLRDDLVLHELGDRAFVAPVQRLLVVVEAGRHVTVNLVEDRLLIGFDVATVERGRDSAKATTNIVAHKTRDNYAFGCNDSADGQRVASVSVRHQCALNHVVLLHGVVELRQRGAFDVFNAIDGVRFHAFSYLNRSMK